LKLLGSAELWVTALNLMVALLSVALFIAVMALEGYTVSRTRQRFMEELKIFIRPPASKKAKLMQRMIDQCRTG
jgi:Flp pilus assembly protein protease CpaA